MGTPPLRWAACSDASLLFSVKKFFLISNLNLPWRNLRPNACAYLASPSPVSDLFPSGKAGGKAAIPWDPDLALKVEGLGKKQP